MRKLISSINVPYNFTTSLAEYYTQSVKNSTRLYPNRQPYVTHRMINDVTGKNIRRDWNDLNDEIKQHMKTKVDVGKEYKNSSRQQSLNLQCGNGCF